VLQLDHPVHQQQHRPGDGKRVSDRATAGGLRAHPALGATLHETIRALVTWTEGHQNEIAAARAAYDVRVAAERRATADEAAKREAIARDVLTAGR
jgi:hypothetical protein